MPIFRYVVRDSRGVAQTGQLEAVSLDEAVAQLQHRGLFVTFITAKDLAGPSVGRPVARQAVRMHHRVTIQDQVLLCQQLETLIDAGVPLLRSLEVACAQMESRLLLTALEEVRRDVAAGRTFRDALARHPHIFSGLWLNLIETGEASGHLSQSLRQLARHFESAQRLKSETQTALTYPAFLIVVAIVVLALFVYWLIPKFSTVFATMELEMPPLTKAVIGLSHLARRYVLVLAGAVVGGVALLRRYLRTEPGQWMRDGLLLRLPYFQRLFTNVQLAGFSQGLSTLLESGVPLLTSLEILERSATNKFYGQAIRAVKEAVQQGKPMARPMEETGMFPPMTVQMVQVGEEVGQLGAMVGRLAKYYEQQVEIFIARMTRLFEPIAILIMGGLVLVIVLSIFLPIFKLATGVRG